MWTGRPDASTCPLNGARSPTHPFSLALGQRWRASEGTTSVANEPMPTWPTRCHPGNLTLKMRGTAAREPLPTQPGKSTHMRSWRPPNLPHPAERNPPSPFQRRRQGHEQTVYHFLPPPRSRLRRRVRHAGSPALARHTLLRSQEVARTTKRCLCGPPNCSRRPGVVDVAVDAA